MNVTPGIELVKQIEQAAQLRAEGRSWEVIAKRLGLRRIETCRRWLVRYPILWRQLYAEAWDDIRKAADVEAVASLRDLLRSENEMIRRFAAWNLLSVKRRPDQHADTADPLAGLSDDELRAMLEQYDSQNAALANPAAVDAPEAASEAG